MRRMCLDLLRCPRCRHHPLDLQETASTEREIREGTLRCHACGAAFAIVRGVAELLNDPSAQVREELESIDSWLPEVEKVTPLNDDLCEFPVLVRSLADGADADGFRGAWTLQPRRDFDRRW